MVSGLVSRALSFEEPVRNCAVFPAAFIGKLITHEIIDIVQLPGTPRFSRSFWKPRLLTAAKFLGEVPNKQKSKHSL